MTPSRLVLVADRFLLDSELVLRRLGDDVRGRACRSEEIERQRLDDVDVVLVDAAAPESVINGICDRGVALGLLHDGQVPRDRRQHPGVRLLLPRDCAPSEIRHGVAKVLSGGVHRDTTSRSGVATAPALSPRESDVLALLARGLANRDIADELDISPHTVRTHVQALLVKLDRGNRVAAVGAARRAGLLPR